MMLDLGKVLYEANLFNMNFCTIIILLCDSWSPSVCSFYYYVIDGVQVCALFLSMCCKHVHILADHACYFVN